MPLCCVQKFHMTLGLGSYTQSGLFSSIIIFYCFNFYKPSIIDDVIGLRGVFDLY